jgi:ribosome-associated translation inhibitor RaiA
MRLSQFSQGFELTDAIAAHVESRVRLALGTASEQIDAVSVRLTDVNADRGGNDKRCRMVARLRNLPAVVVEMTHADLYAAIDGAAASAKEAVWRHLKRRRTLRREYANRSRHLYA